MHGADAFVGAKNGAKEASAKVKTLQLRFEGELDRLRGEVADDNEDGRDGGDGLGFADPGEDVLIVMVEGGGLTPADGGVAVMERGELAIPVDQRGWVGILKGCVG